MNKQKTHDIKASLRFLENLYEELSLCQNINDLQHPLVMQKFRQTIDFLEKTLST